MAINKVHYSCKDAFNFLPLWSIEEVKNSLYEIFGCTTWQQFYLKRKDYPNIPAQVKEEVESLFDKYGVKKEEIWKIWKD